ncbi:MAG: tRNA (adenosine(37)-N6)-threonylcarbamoyltransferase complex ATPase subunit type 1 TsaE [Bacteroidetes bacterium]|nr:tRNA (adenosine(37)-N6)-threonylcarbamoyltransferase complex ATPase subunit type 1 TsaE [Bacteroidota bacterium]MCW5894206.1 tRNA (adenosine(37)-N6)-threonylcarbamoyltransferase complex ATPase subunit type 1 TsaE [Bacteroidota bacterium]
MKKFLSGSADETAALGKTFAQELRPGDVVTLSGNLGSGKTRFVVGMCEGLHAHGHVASPTFTIINEYEAPFGKVIHIDLYRINRRTEIRELGIEEYFTDRCICMIEWPELVSDLLPSKRFEVVIDFGTGENDRVISVKESVPA